MVASLTNDAEAGFTEATGTEPGRAAEVAEAIKAEHGAGGEDAPRPRRGRPPGAKNKKGAKRSAAPQADDVPMDYTPTDVEVKAATLLGATIWKFAGKMLGYRELDPVSEAPELGAALAPLVKKYLPLLAEWQYEINAAMVIFALAEQTKIRREVAAKSNSDGPGTES